MPQRTCSTNVHIFSSRKRRIREFPFALMTVLLIGNADFYDAVFVWAGLRAFFSICPRSRQAKEPLDLPAETTRQWRMVPTTGTLEGWI